jgi:hypothetical protein
MFLRVTYPGGGEEKVDIDALLDRLHRHADPIAFLDSIFFEGCAMARLEDGQTICAAPWRAAGPARAADDGPEQLNLPAVIPAPRTYDLDVVLELTATTRAQVLATSPQEAEATFRDWLAGDRSPGTCRLDETSLVASLRDNFEFARKNQGWGDLQWRVAHATPVPLALEASR